MEINFIPQGKREILQIDDVRLVYRNFKGEGSKFNREGDRNFAVVIPDEEAANLLKDHGYNVKIKPPRDEDDSPFMYLPVKIKFNDRGPRAYLKAGRDEPVQLNEDSISILDDIDISSVDLDIRPFDWEMPNGMTGRTAYLESIHVIQEVDRFAARYQSQMGFGWGTGRCQENEPEPMTDRIR